MEKVVSRVFSAARRCPASKLSSGKKGRKPSATASSVRAGTPRLSARRAMPETSFARSASLSGRRSPLR